MVSRPLSGERAPAPEKMQQLAKINAAQASHLDRIARECRACRRRA